MQRFTFAILLTLLAFVVAGPALAEPPEPIEADLVEAVGVPADASADASAEIAEPLTCTPEQAEAFSAIPSTVIETLSFLGGGNCNKPGDCPYGGYCYDDCSPCQTRFDCDIFLCTSIPLC